MDNLYAPWRSPYSSSLHDTNQNTNAPHSCVFCIEKNLQNDSELFILKRYQHCYVILNKYPYNAGHCMVIPFCHVQELSHLNHQELHEIMDVLAQTTDIIQKQLRCQGINIGLNLGKAAGAGIPNHLHMHILPRWQGDTNFLPTLANTKVVSFDLSEIYSLLKPHFNT